MSSPLSFNKKHMAPSMTYCSTVMLTLCILLNIVGRLGFFPKKAINRLCFHQHRGITPLAESYMCSSMGFPFSPQESPGGRRRGKGASLPGARTHANPPPPFSSRYSLLSWWENPRGAMPAGRRQCWLPYHIVDRLSSTLYELFGR